ncbi:E3 ubiquitin-protein ligase Zswim2-like [Babylonia areolata]|uniref:E3 ubiquitin-protein ligase Zswim2-like n=1 Tax=Babylonia areolata TaxID=304850 RepID=UPI003FD055E1
MPRNVAWRRTYSDVACASQMFAANATIYILRQTGPTGFLLKEENESKNFKVFLGDPHSCTCPAFRKEKDLCKHICWVLLKKFRLSQDDPLSWQLGLSDIELDEVMRGPAIARRAQQQQQQQQRQQAAASQQVADASGGRPMVPQRDIADDDVCPICQDEFMNKKLPVTFCKFGCGNNVHIKCMKVWAEHQLKSSQDKVIKCPMCREDFGPITLLKQEMRNADAVTSTAPSAPSNPNRMDRHVGIGCSNCRMAPIEGKCYRCCTCTDFYLCQACFNTPAHTHHSFQFRHKRNQRWRNAQRMLGAALPDAMINDLMNRELSASDYDTLLQLDNSASAGAGAPLSDLTEEVLQMLPVERVRERGPLLAPGAQCRVCLRGFAVGQYVRKLPCQHKFHKDCIDAWLLHSHPTCPIDSSPVFTTRPHSDTAANNRQANRIGNSSASSHQGAGDSATGLRGHHDEVHSLSVPSLGVTAMRVGVAEDYRRDGDRGILARRPPRDPHIPHRPPARLELTGTRVGSEDGANVRQDRASQQPDMVVPGGRLLQEAMERRSQLNQHLTQLMMENTLMPAAGSPTEGRDDHDQQADLTPSSGHGGSARAGNLHFLFDAPRHQGGAGSPSSLPERTHQRRQPASVRAKGPLRQRSGSVGRIPPSAVQDLYLGNDPRVNPPPLGEVAMAQLSGGRGSQYGGIHRPLPLSRKPLRGRGRGSNHSSIRLEGNSALDHLTLRDLL